MRKLPSALKSKMKLLRIVALYPAGFNVLTIWLLRHATPTPPIERMTVLPAEPSSPIPNIV